MNTPSPRASSAKATKSDSCRPSPAASIDPAETESADEIRLTRDIINADKLVSAAKQGSDGAVVVFDGIVRNNSRGRQTLHLDYEAYEEMALKQMRELADQRPKPASTSATSPSSIV